MAKVLVAVSDPDVLNPVIQTLESMGHWVIKANGGALAQDILIANTDINLLVIDADLPDIPPGRILSRLLREVPSIQTLPFVILSSKTKYNEEEELIELGASYFVAKPLNPERLRETVSKILSKKC